MSEKLFKDIYDAIKSGSAFIVESSLEDRTIVRIFAKGPYELEDLVYFEPEEIAAQLSVALSGFVSGKPVTNSCETLSPEEFKMRHVAKPLTPIGLRVKSGVIQLFVSPVIDVEISKETPWMLDLAFVAFNKTVSLTPSCALR